MELLWDPGHSLRNTLRVKSNVGLLDSLLERQLIVDSSSFLGGMGINNPTTVSNSVYQDSKRLTASLVTLIVMQDGNQVIDSEVASNTTKNANRWLQNMGAKHIYEQLLPQQQRGMDLAQGSGVINLCIRVNC